jgi:hypothetical protein
MRNWRQAKSQLMLLSNQKVYTFKQYISYTRRAMRGVPVTSLTMFLSAAAQILTWLEVPTVYIMVFGILPNSCVQPLGCWNRVTGIEPVS